MIDVISINKSIRLAKDKFHIKKIKLHMQNVIKVHFWKLKLILLDSSDKYVWTGAPWK